MKHAMQRELDKLANEYDKKFEKICSKYRDKYVVPYCEKHGLKFVPGMGTWVFFGNGTLYIDSDHVGLPKRLAAVLTADCLYGQDAGSLMVPYTATTYKDKSHTR